MLLNSFVQPEDRFIGVAKSIVNQGKMVRWYPPARFLGKLVQLVDDRLSFCCLAGLCQCEPFISERHSLPGRQFGGSTPFSDGFRIHSLEYVHAFSKEMWEPEIRGQCLCFLQGSKSVIESPRLHEKLAFE